MVNLVKIETTSIFSFFASMFEAYDNFHVARHTLLFLGVTDVMAHKDTQNTIVQ
jgi:hypothetical protein